MSKNLGRAYYAFIITGPLAFGLYVHVDHQKRLKEYNMRQLRHAYNNRTQEISKPQHSLSVDFARANIVNAAYGLTGESLDSSYTQSDLE